MSNKESKPDALNIVSRAIDAIQDGEQKSVIVLQPDRMMDSLRKSIDDLIDKEERILKEVADAKQQVAEWEAKWGDKKSNNTAMEYLRGYKAHENSVRESSQERLEYLRTLRKNYEEMLNRLMEAAIRRLEQE